MVVFYWIQNGYRLSMVCLAMRHDGDLEWDRLEAQEELTLYGGVTRL